MTAGRLVKQADVQSAAAPSQRLDRWLWFARSVKSRTLAAALIDSGKIRVNAVKVVKPSFGVKIGDVVVSAANKDVRILQVKGLGARRGPASEAQLLYEDLTPVPTATPLGGAADATLEAANNGRRDQGSGRPSKRDRRQLERLQGRN